MGYDLVSKAKFRMMHVPDSGDIWIFYMGNGQVSYSRNMLGNVFGKRVKRECILQSLAICMLSYYMDSCFRLMLLSKFASFVLRGL